MSKTVFTPKLKTERSVDFSEMLKAIGAGISDMGAYTAQAAAQANAISAQAQAAQMAFNAGQAMQANMLTDNRLASQYQFNSAQANMANQFSANMWQQTANWNEAMWQKQADFNAEQAEIQRQWSEQMENTRYQRAINDMSKAGLNPILAVTNGISTGAGSAPAASVGGASMGSAQGVAANGGMAGGLAGSASNYTGQMEYMSGTLGLLSAVFSGLSSASGALGGLGDFGADLGNSLTDIFLDKSGNIDEEKIWNNAKKVGKWVYDNNPISGANVGKKIGDQISKYFK